MDARNRRESQMISMSSIEKREREKLFEQQPGISEQELQLKVARLMKAGQRPATSTPLPSLGIPEKVQAARKLERDNVVRQRKNKQPKIS
ncbi:hypothetical protein ASD67_10735 [Sphingopyxis sp. Root1497]|nr:hypothetical protein ASD67_10735 [Sphingopyxis sp. Root1497]